MEDQILEGQVLYKHWLCGALPPPVSQNLKPDPIGRPATDVDSSIQYATSPIPLTLRN